MKITCIISILAVLSSFIILVSYNSRSELGNLFSKKYLIPNGLRLTINEMIYRILGIAVQWNIPWRLRFYQFTSFWYTTKLIIT